MRVTRAGRGDGFDATVNVLKRALIWSRTQGVATASTDFLIRVWHRNTFENLFTLVPPPPPPPLPPLAA